VAQVFAKKTQASGSEPFADVIGFSV